MEGKLRSNNNIWKDEGANEANNIVFKEHARRLGLCAYACARQFS